MSESLSLFIDRPVAGGRMLARHEGRVVLVAGAIPGERVRARIEKVTRAVTWATVEHVIEPSADRREPRCDPACGGSAYAHIQYERQRLIKRDVIEDAFRRIGRMSIEAPVPASSPEEGYRLRAKLHVRGRRAGFFREGTHALCDAGPTGQLRPDTRAAIDATLAALTTRLAECDALVVAENVTAGERVVHVVPRDGARLADLAGGLARPDGVAGLTTSDRPGAIVTLAGAPAVTDRSADLAGLADGLPPVTWTRHAASFFQGNRYLLGALVGRVLALASGERFVDLYAGVGLFAAALAAAGRRGLAVEGDPIAAADLAANAAPWDDRLRVLRSPVEDAVSVLLDPAPDVVVLDPPRTGVSPAALAGVIDWCPPRVLYVSCDPPTLARDAARLTASGYALASLEAFDLFPNTPHVEAIAVFTRG